MYQRKDPPMKTLTALLLAALAAPQDFSGEWEFNPARSKNVGMMSEMKLTAVMKQTATELSIVNVSVFNKQEDKTEVVLDLTGKSVSNHNPMEAPAQTVTKWDGKRLVTTWTSPGS